MVHFVVFVLAVSVFSVVWCKPLESSNNVEEKAHHLWKRFINTALSSGTFDDNHFSKIRARREADEDCEKLRLCKLHAESSRNFFAAYELYFVNKENARLWDHHAHSMADCESRYSGCYGGAARAQPAEKQSSFRGYYDDDDY